MLVFGILGIAVFIVIIVIYFHRRLSHRDWLNTDDGILQQALEDLQRNPKSIESLLITGSIFYKKKIMKNLLNAIQKLSF